MTDFESIKAAPLANLDYFAHGEVRPWQKFIEIAIGAYLGEDLSGLRLLEIGPGSERISALFAILGAQVTALALRQENIDNTVAMARNFKVDANVECLLYDGDLGILGERKFDIVFSRSALIYNDPLDKFLTSLLSFLSENGRAVLIENGRGNFLMTIYRLLKRRSISFSKQTHFFTQKEIDLIRGMLKIELLMRSKLPPIYLICGKKH